MVQSCRVIWEQFTTLLPKNIASKPIMATRAPNIYLLGWVLGQNISKQLRPKNDSPQTCQQTNPIKTCEGHKAPNIYLMGCVLDHNFSKPIRSKNVSPKTCQETNLMKTYKGHKAPNIYLTRVGAGPVFFKTGQAQKCFTQDLSGNQLYKNL